MRTVAVCACCRLPAVKTLLSPWLVACCAIAAGALLPLSLAPFDYWPLGLVSAALLFLLLQRAPERAVGLNFWFAFGQYAVGASWVYVSIREHGNASMLLAGFMVGLFVVFLAALFGWTRGVAYRLCVPPGQRDGFVRAWLQPALAFLVLWVLWEWLTTWVLTGFPWLLLGQAHVATVLGALAPVGGALLVSFAAVASVLAGVLTIVLLRQRSIYAVAGGGVAVLPWVLGALLTSHAWIELQPARTVALVQNDIDQRTKWQPEQQSRWVKRQLRLSEPYWDHALLVWPEAAVTLFEHEAEPLLREWHERARSTGTSFVFGVPMLERHPDGEFSFHNGVRAIGLGSGRYLKRHLTPFGEYVPMAGLLRGLIDFFDLPMSRSKPGPLRQPLLRLDDLQASMAVCYEIAYPRLVADHGGAAAVLLTISNDAWFGRSIGPHQHLQIAQMRALENGRYVLRAAQNGITAIIDAQGVVRARLPQFEAGTLTGEFHPATGATPFVRFGHVPVLGLAGLLLLAVLSLRLWS